MSEFKIPDYTKDSDVDDKMIAKSSPLFNVIKNDNIKFESQNEIEGMPPQGGTFRTNTSDSRLEVNQPYNAFIVYLNNLARVAIGAEPGTGGAGTVALADSIGDFSGGFLGLRGVNRSPNREMIGVTGDLIPTTNETRDLGTTDSDGFGTDLRWDWIYLGHNPDVSSDRRLKDNIRSIGYGLDAIEKLRPVQFLKHGVETLGFIAQDVYEVIPEITRNVNRPQVYASMIYEGVIPVLVKAVQELSSKVANLEEQLSNK